MNLSFPQARRHGYECSGMTVLETLLAIGMLTVFTGVVVMVMQFTFSFFKESESGDKNELEVSNGVLIDHQELHLAMDSLVELLSQPGISRDRLFAQERCPTGNPPPNCLKCPDNDKERCYPGIQIAFDPGDAQPSEACVSSPVANWGLSKLMPEVYLPPGYRLCLWTTTEKETNPDQYGKSGAGIYLLQALPEQVTPSSLPTRRLFCRPRPFC
jgi:hypothetical protein